VQGIKKKALDQRAQVYQAASFPNQLPKSLQPKFKAMFAESYKAETRAQASDTFDRFLTTSGARQPKATECWPRAATRCSPSAIFPPSISCTSAQLTRSSPPVPRCARGPTGPKAPTPAWPT
jgi:hypothetical protein